MIQIQAMSYEKQNLQSEKTYTFVCLTQGRKIT